MRILLGVLLLLASPAAALAADYPKRLEMIEWLGHHYPGYVSARPADHADLGLWGGIMIQTEWQMATGRDRLFLWDRINQSLTIEPYHYAHDFESGVQCANPVCKAWYAYFQVGKFQGPPATLPHAIDPRWIRAQKRLWKAHRLAIDAALEQARSELDAAMPQTPADEAHFWRGWTRLVHLFADGLAPTFAAEIWPISDRLLPDCGPLAGSPPCASRLLRPADRRLYTEAIIANGASELPPNLAAADLEALPERGPSATADVAASAPFSWSTGLPCIPWRERDLESQRRAALLSIHFFAYNASDEALPDALKPIPLADAVRILKQDDSPEGSDRRTRAAMALYEASPQGAQREAYAALAPEGAAALALPATAPADDAERNARASAFSDSLSAAPPAAPACKRTTPTTSFDEPGDGVVAVTYALDVERTPADLARLIDPQAWSRCSERFFADTCIVNRTPEGGYAADPAPPALGSAYPDRLLFEHFVYDMSCSWVGFKNILGVSASGGSDPAVRYDLAEPLSTDLPFGWARGGLEVDRGHLKATRKSESWTHLEIRKEIRFGGNYATWFFNLWRKPMLRVLASEIYDSACCAPAAPPQQCRVER